VSHEPGAVRGRQVQLVRYPDGPLRPEDVRIVERRAPDPEAGEVLVRNTWCSVDPGMRLQMRRVAPAGYFTPFELNAPLTGMAVGQVVESRAEAQRIAIPPSTLSTCPVTKLLPGPSR
jgi:hypothetical protein